MGRRQNSAFPAGQALRLRFSPDRIMPAGVFEAEFREHPTAGLLIEPVLR